MKRKFLATAVVLAILCTSAIHAIDADREKLITIEHEWNEAYNRQDKNVVGQYLADDFVLIDADAYVLNKRQYLDTISRVQVKSDNLKVVSVRVYGDAAVVTTVWSGTYSFDGKDTSETIRYTDLFIKQKGNWRTVASQGTRVPRR